MGGETHALKRIPLIKFPQRHLKSSDSVTKSQEVPKATRSGNGDLPSFSSSKGAMTAGGKASLQPKRTPVSNEEIEAILLGSCI